MSNPVTLKTRVKHKHDIPAHWDRAINFIPLAGEIIIYDDHYFDENGNKIVVADAVRFKVGDGVIQEDDTVVGTKLNDLPFALDSADLNLQKSCGDRTISTKPRINDSGEVKEALAYQKDSIALAYKGQAGMTAEEFAVKYPGGKDDWGHTYEQSFGIAFAEGLETRALGRNSHAQNRATQALANDSSASGVETVASGINGSNANGFQTVASGPSSFTANYQTKATGQSAAAFGIGGEASGKGAFKTGGDTLASGEYSFTEGINTRATGNHSHAQNRGTQAIADDASASGVESIASGGNGSNANGFKTQAKGTSSFTANDQTIASGAAAAAFGSGGEASGDASFKTGKFNVTSGAGSFSTGESNVSSRGNAFTEGQECRAEEWNAYAGGYKTHATTRHSFARGEGLRTVALNQTVFGKYNVSNSNDYNGTLPVLTVGYGTSDTNRKDVFNVLRDGRAIVLKTTSSLTDAVNVEYLNKCIYEKAVIATFNISEERTEITLSNLEGMTEIDWGDGTINSELSHTYVNIGKYICKIYNVLHIGKLFSWEEFFGGGSIHNAFKDCESLQSIILPEGVISIGTAAFENCNNLTSIVIPNSTTLIGDFAFCNCTKLTSVNIPNGVDSLGDHLFYNCNLTSIEIPNSVTSIDSYAFGGCSSLTSVVIPDSVTSIDSFAFDSCSSLVSLVIGSSVSSLGERMCAGCTSLQSVTFKNTSPVYLWSLAFLRGCTQIYVPYGCSKAYKTQWAELLWEEGAEDILDLIVEESDRKAMMSDIDNLNIELQNYIQQYLKNHFAELMSEYLAESSATTDDIKTLFNKEV